MLISDTAGPISLDVIAFAHEQGPLVCLAMSGLGGKQSKLRLTDTQR